MGRLVAFAIGFAILSFVLADLFGQNSFIRGTNNNVGEIDGDDISHDEYQNQIDELSASYSFNFGRNPSEQEMATIRDQAWELLIVKHAYQNQYDKIGLEVKDDELVDMVQGKNINPSIQQAFVNPSTGEFDKQAVINYLQNIQQAPAQQQVAWHLFEKDLKPSRLRLKYDNLLIKSTYVTTAEAENFYKDQTAVAEVKYLNIPYYSVNDSLVNVTDDELKDYLSQHSKEYQVKYTRSFQYVSFPIVPSTEDTAYVRNEIESLKAEFAKRDDDSVYAAINSDEVNSFNQYHIDDLPPSVKPHQDELTEGMVIGPVFEGNGFKLYKISKITSDSIYRAKASHILVKWTDDSEKAKKEAKDKAQDVLNQIRNGADFAEMARQYGEDGTASRGGDLGWGTQGKTWVKDFEEPVFAATSAGLINHVVESQFGYHIIEVTGVKTNKVYEISSIVKEVTSSDETIEDAFRKAGLFKSAVDNYDEFKKKADADSLEIGQGSKITANQRNIPGLGSARVIVQWLFNTASNGSISDVFELDDAYVVAVMISETQEGTAPLNDVRAQISQKVKNKKKADIIINKLKSLSGSLDSIAASYGPDAKVYSSSDLKLNTNFLPSVGMSSEAIGRTFSLKEGEKTAPIPVDAGVVIVQLNKLTPASDIADYTTYENQLKQNISGRAAYNLSEAIKESADIKDKRYKFY